MRMLPIFSSFRQFFSRFLRQLFSKILYYFFRNRSILEWPSWFGEFANISIPQRVTNRPYPQTRGAANINVIFELLEKTNHLDGEIAECGVFQGSTLIPIALYQKEKMINKSIFGLDSFEGFDEMVNIDIELGGSEDSRKKHGGFSQTSLKYVLKQAEGFKVSSRIILLQGFFINSLHQIENKKFSFVHLDCDLYYSYKVCLDFFYPRLVKGGIILFDEYNDPPWPGCNKAVDEFLADKKEKCIEIERNNYLKYYILKDQY
jgi:hypothetical protein